MITSVVVASIINVTLMVYLFFLMRKTKKERSILIRQNLVYIVSFVNYFDWIKSTYAPGVIAAVLSDSNYVQYMKKNGLPEKVFSGIVENALAKSNSELQAKTQEVLNDIKQPLASEINAILENE